MSTVEIKSYLGEYGRKVLFGRAQKDPCEAFEKTLKRVLLELSEDLFEKRMAIIVETLFKAPNPEAVRSVAMKFMLREIEKAQEGSFQYETGICDACMDKMCNDCGRVKVKYVPYVIDEDGVYREFRNPWEHNSKYEWEWMEKKGRYLEQEQCQ
jgi:hypothetical protein